MTSMTDAERLDAVRELVMRLGAALAHDDEQEQEAALDALGTLLYISGADMDAYHDHYHHERGGNSHHGPPDRLGRPRRPD